MCQCLQTFTVLIVHHFRLIKCKNTWTSKSVVWDLFLYKFTLYVTLELDPPKSNSRHFYNDHLISSDVVSCVVQRCVTCSFYCINGIFSDSQSIYFINYNSNHIAYCVMCDINVPSSIPSLLTYLKRRFIQEMDTWAKNYGALFLLQIYSSRQFMVSF